MTYLTREQVRRIDRLAMSRYHIPGIVLMENAARAVAAAADAMLRRAPRQRSPAPAARGGLVLVLCGGGNNGGDGLAAARHLHNHGRRVLIALCTDPQRYEGDALVNWRIVQAMGLATVEASARAIASARADLIVDAIFGTGLTQPPRPPFERYARAVQRSGAPVLAVDLPSGLDCDSGRPLGPCIRATRTVTFVARKAGFANPQSRQFTGRVTVADIGCPRELIESVAQEP
jgi:NAD(P)H-hydrate epimerase